MKPETLTRWTCENAAELYGIRNWGAGYFDISEKGNIVAKPRGSGSDVKVDLMDVVRHLQSRDLTMPVLVRFADIIASQVRSINKSFDKAIREAGYQGIYRGVYPVKVNQKQKVVTDIMEFGREFHYGLEVGSKAELIAAIANICDSEAFLICNGYKDPEFMDLALRAQKMGIHIFIVMEMPNELHTVIDRALSIGVRPRLGVRAKLASRAGGHWDGSGGDRSKFGLDPSQIIDMVDQLRSNKMLDCLEMLHYHLGSQIPDIRRVRQALQEAARLYGSLVKEGAAMGVINVGGGLAVDYDGSRTNFASSSNYSTAEYAADVVETIMTMADEIEVPHPMIVTESGRATVAHHSVLLFNILDTRRFEPHSLPEELPADAHEMLRNLMDVKDSLTSRNFQEAYHDAIHYRDEIRSTFLHGDVSLRDRAFAENIFWHIIRQIANLAQHRKYVPDEMEGLEQAISDVYYGNFSLFQSLPDSWAIDQLFPVAPIHRLNEVPTRQAVLADITCDSDGKIDKFIDLRDVKHILPLHELNHEEYYLGIFLVGAYQETLGDMHNLLGDVNVLHVRVDEDGEPRYVREIPGDTVEKVLRFVEYDPPSLLEKVRATAQQAVVVGKMTEAERDAVVAAFDEGMKGYTYFER